MNYENLKRLFQELTDIVSKERKVVFGVIILVAIFKACLFWIEKNNVQDLPKITNVAGISSEESAPLTGKQRFNEEISSKEMKIELKPFDPNTASYQVLVSLGIPSKTANILINWREKGKVFRSKEELQKVYGMTPETYARIYPYIVIATSHYTSAEPQYEKQEKTFYSKEKPKLIDINTANEEAWKSLPGIGNGFAASIVKYRTALGGFYDVAQISEVYYLHDSVYQKIKPYLGLHTRTIKKIKINDASFEELDAHPYISKKQAENIIKNRPIFGYEDLLELYFFKDPTKTEKLKPYLSF